MIINRTSKNIIKKEIILTLPQIYLDLDYEYRITVIDFYIKWKTPPGQNMFALRTNMISRTTGNPTQDLIHFSTDNDQLASHFQPTQFTTHKVKFLDIQTAVFYLHSYTSDTPENIDFISLSIEIV